MAVFATPLQITKNSKDHSSKSTIKVFIRSRPLLAKEVLDGAQNILTFIPKENKVLVEDGFKGKFIYDGIFDEEASQEDVFQMAVSPFLNYMYNGHNVTIIAYGQTGSGKTYTIGTNPGLSQKDGGMLQRVMKTLLSDEGNSEVYKENGDIFKNGYSVQMSFLEVYNESVFDLFSARNSVETKPDGFGGVTPVGFKEEMVSSLEEGFKLLEKGNSQRKVAATVMNAHSSRSHAIISLSLCQKLGNGDYSRKGYLRMVDLAGAEGVGRNKMEGKGFCEGVNINKGLLTIGKVLAALASDSAVPHIPYRESMVTRLLREALGGNSYTTMISCVSPASTNLSVTLSTLRYAQQARHIRNRPSTAYSSIKRAGLKGLEDVSATPTASKKFRVLKEKFEHNATISTPGHKPPIIKIQPLNNTFAVPLNRMSGSVRNLPRSSSKMDLTSADLPLKQPMFEDESVCLSPTHSTIVPASTNESILQLSPLVERVNSRLEQSLLSHLKDMERRLAHRVVGMLTQGTRAKRRSKRLGIKTPSKLNLEAVSTVSLTRKLESLMSPRCSFESSLALDNSRGDPSPVNFADSIAEALIRKETFQNALKGAFVKTANEGCEDLTDIKPPFLKEEYCVPEYKTVDLSLWDSQKTLDAGQIFGNPCDMGENPLSHQHRFEKDSLPVTSTIIPVRKSARLSALNPYSPMHSHCSVSSLEVTAIYMPDNSQAASPALRRDSSMVPSAMRQNLSIIQQLPMNQTIDQGKFAATQRNKLPTVLGPPSSKVKRRSSTRINANLRPYDWGPQDASKGRPRRKSALISSQKTCAMLNARDSPLQQLPRKARAKVIKLSDDQSMCEDKWRLVISPTLQKQHSDEIINILNSADLRGLQKLPTVGPKTAMVIYNFRKMYGKLTTVEDIRKIPGLPKSYLTRFMKANLMQKIEVS